MNDWQELITWSEMMESQIFKRKLALDLASAEQLIDKHQELMV